jgi:hypothetical protein
MMDILIGAAGVSGLWLLREYARRNRIQPAWWQWGLPGMGIIYSVFVLEMIHSFLSEGAARGALVMGLIFGFPALVWAVLLGRFVFSATAAERRKPMQGVSRNE